MRCIHVQMFNPIEGLEKTLLIIIINVVLVASYCSFFIMNVLKHSLTFSAHYLVKANISGWKCINPLMLKSSCRIVVWT